MSFKQTWWDNNISKKMNEFESWIGGSDSRSKVYLREYIKEKEYESIIDLGCGTATEFFAYKKELPNVDYRGLDSSKILYDINTTKGVPMILAPAEDTGLMDNIVDCVFSRHVLEHQPDFRPILTEMVRLAKKEAIHIFFIIPRHKEIIDYNEKENLYHNTYNRSEVTDFLLSLEKVEDVTWKNLHVEEILHIKIKE